MEVRVRALIWVNGLVVIHEERRQGEWHRTLPGGRVRESESLRDALRREIGEELGVEVEVGDLMYVAEVVHGHTVQHLNLIFAAELADLAAADHVALADPRRDGDVVLPPVLERVTGDRDDEDRRPRWLGNLWRPGVHAVATLHPGGRRP